MRRRNTQPDPKAKPSTSIASMGARTRAIKAHGEASYAASARGDYQTSTRHDIEARRLYGQNYDANNKARRR